MPILIADRRALIWSLAEQGPADGSRPGQSGPCRQTWQRVQAAGWVDSRTHLPSPTPPAITKAGLEALDLPPRVSGADDALRAIVRSRVLGWRRPTLRFRPNLPSISIDADDAVDAPVQLGSHPLGRSRVRPQRARGL
jgi:hypothetical protein